MKRLLLSVTVCLALLSCQKEIENPTDQQRATSTGCKLATVYHHNAAGAIDDSAVYTYKGEKPAKVFQNAGTDSTLFQYTGNNLTKRTFYRGGVVVNYSHLSYHADGNVKTIAEMFDMSALGGSGFECVDSIVFQWNGNKLVKRTHYSLDFFAGGLEKKWETIFEYAGNNITKSIRLSYGSGGGQPLADTTFYEYDTQPNFLRKGGFPHLLADVAFMHPNTIGDYFVLFLSENNPVKVWDAQDPANAQDVLYSKDAKGYLTLIQSGGDALVGYRYQCP